MSDAVVKLATAFDGERRLASGPLIDVAMAVKAATADGAEGPLLAFDDVTGAVIDLDLRGSRADIAARLAAAGGERPAPPRGRGRPSLGVVGREVTLAPRHWEWLAAQPGGASAALAGDLPGFEEATRALFAGDRVRFERLVAPWPGDVGAYATNLAAPALA